jgi:hypothetical protein
MTDAKRAEEIMTRVEALYKKTRRTVFIRTVVDVVLITMLVASMVSMFRQTRAITRYNDSLNQQNKLLYHQNGLIADALRIAKDRK